MFNHSFMFYILLLEYCRKKIYYQQHLYNKTTASTMLQKTPSKPDFALYVCIERLMFIYADECSFALHRMTISILCESELPLLSCLLLFPSRHYLELVDKLSNNCYDER